MWPFLRKLNNTYKTLMALLFATIFHLLSIVLLGLGIFQFINTALQVEKELVAAVVESINTLVISLAMYELGVGVSKEYTSPENGESIYTMVRRTVTRFGVTVCIALILESLIMIIKYSQLELAGNLYYPVGIIIAGGFLLLALGGFLKLTRERTE